MMYHSPSPFEIGAFDVDEAREVAAEINHGNYEVTRTELSGRIVVQYSADATEILKKIGFYNAVDDDTELLRIRLYAQDFAEILPTYFPGYPWHIDADKETFDFNFGSSDHPTEFVVGDIDLTAAYTYTSRLIEGDISPQRVLLWARLHVAEAIDRAVDEGDAVVETMEPGILYRVPGGNIHRMQPFDSDETYPLRFCIEQYLNKT